MSAYVLRDPPTLGRAVAGCARSVRSDELAQASGNTELCRGSSLHALGFPPLQPDVTGETLTVHIPLRVR